MLPAVSESVSFVGRVGLAFACFFRILLDGVLAKRVAGVLSEDPRGLPPRQEPPGPVEEPEAPHEPTEALQLLALLQREGRLVDFLQQDVASFSDEDIGAAARVVHDGCRRTLQAHAELSRVLPDEEGKRVKVPANFDASRIKLTGDVSGSGPFEGVLRHGGWSVQKLQLPKIVGQQDMRVVAPAEVEIGS